MTTPDILSRPLKDLPRALAALPVQELAQLRDEEISFDRRLAVLEAIDAALETAEARARELRGAALRGAITIADTLPSAEAEASAAHARQQARRSAVEQTVTGQHLQKETQR